MINYILGYLFKNPETVSNFLLIFLILFFVFAFKNLFPEKLKNENLVNQEQVIQKNKGTKIDHIVRLVLQISVVLLALIYIGVLILANLQII